jgi:glycosyltransferase involved in cell wall biosynthesis
MIITGMGPTHLVAFLWALYNGAKLVYMTDGTIDSEKNISVIAKFIRIKVFKYINTFIVASNKGKKLIESYGYHNIYKSYLCADNDDFIDEYREYQDREYDLIFSGQIQKRKLPLLFAEVCIEIKKIRGTCKALIIGSGPMEKAMLSKLDENNIDYNFAGFINSNDLKYYYSNSKVLLFLSELDPWGVVANEALASGTPVIVSSIAGCADEIVVNGVSGYTVENNLLTITEKVISLLDNENLWREMSNKSRDIIQEYNYKNAALGIKNAISSISKNGV